jgi:Zn-dependent metalloprotease
MAKRLFFWMVFICGFATFIHAQNLKSLPFIHSFKDKTASRFEVFEKEKEALGLTTDTEMKLVRSYSDKKGIHHDRYHQYYKNRRVIGSTVVVHADGGYVRNITGNFRPHFEKADEKELIKSTDAVKIADRMMVNALAEKQKLNAPPAVIPVTEKIELCYIHAKFPYNTGDLVLAYEIIQTVSLWRIPYKMAHYVRAVTGEPIVSVDKILDHKSRGSGLTNYYGPVTFDHDSISPTEFQLRDLSRGEGIFVLNSKTFKGYTNNTSEWNFTDPNEKAAVDVLYGAQNFYDLLRDRFQYNSLDNQGFPMIGGVNNILLNNAYWDGTSTTYGAGDCHNYKSFTSLDIVGHEFAHGLTEFNSNLMYIGESGAINESISDIFGKALEYYTKPNHFTWTLGHKVVRTGISPFRSMSNPNSRDQPNYYKGSYWSDFIYDVHTNSGVMNFWFYLLVKGGSGKNEKNVVYQVKPIGMDKALDIVFLLNTAYLTETSTFTQLYEYSKILAEELYGSESDEFKSVLEAWKAVGLPVIPQENINLTLTGLLNGSPELNPFTCWQNPNPLTFTFVNDSKQVIPPDASINVLITARYNYAGAEKLDTIFNGIKAIQDSLRFGQSIEVGADFYLPPPVSQVILYANVRVNYPGTFYSNTFLKSMAFIHQPASPKDYFSPMFVGNQIENICNNQSRVLQSSFNLEYHACENSQYIFEHEFTDGQQSVSYFDTMDVRVNRIFNFVRTVVQNPDLSTFNKTSDIMVNIHFWLNGQKYYITSDTLAHRFLKTLVENDTIDFNELEDFRNELRLVVYPCIFCPVDLTDQNLNMVNDWSNAKINDCIPLEDFYTEIYNDPFAQLDFSKITGCVNTETMIEPVLSLEAHLYSDWSSGNPDHRHGLLLYENGVLKTNPAITNSGQGFRRFEFPLNSMDKNKIDMDIYLNGAGVSIDNIFIYDKFYTGTSDLHDDLPFTVTNPASDFVTFRWKKISGDYFNTKIYNINGQPVFEGVLSTSTTGIDCSAWPPGFYKYEISNQKDSYQGKLIVIR